MADVLLALAAEDPGGPGLGAVRPAWTSIGFGQDMLAAARAVATDAGASPLVPWSVLRGNGGNLVEFQGTQQAVVEGASCPCVRLWDRWLRLVPEVEHYHAGRTYAGPGASAEGSVRLHDEAVLLVHDAILHTQAVH